MWRNWFIVLSSFLLFPTNTTYSGQIDTVALCPDQECFAGACIIDIRCQDGRTSRKCQPSDTLVRTLDAAKSGNYSQPCIAECDSCWPR